MEQTRKIPLSVLGSELPAELDYFICCASFESRCLAVADSIDPKRPRRTLVVQNGSISDVIGNNSSYLLNRFQPVASSAEIDPSDPLQSEDNLANALLDVFTGSKKNILVDITTFTRESLLILLNQFYRMLRHDDTVLLAYTGALAYCLDEQQPDLMWLTRGVREVRSVLGFPGVVQPSRRTHLIVLVGFESDRAIQLISAYEPAVLSLGYGPATSSINENHHRLNVIFHEKVAALFGEVHRFEFPPADILGTKAAVLQQADKFPSVNIVVGALNTKISTVGVGLAAFENRVIQLSYAEADIYNFANYSSPAMDCYIFKLYNFGAAAMPF